MLHMSALVVSPTAPLRKAKKLALQKIVAQISSLKLFFLRYARKRYPYGVLATSDFCVNSISSSLKLFLFDLQSFTTFVGLKVIVMYHA